MAGENPFDRPSESVWQGIVAELEEGGANGSFDSRVEEIDPRPRLILPEGMNELLDSKDLEAAVGWNTEFFGDEDLILLMDAVSAAVGQKGFASLLDQFSYEQHEDGTVVAVYTAPGGNKHE